MKTLEAVLAGVVVAFCYASAQAGMADRIVAVVNNDVITLSELNAAFEPYLEKMEASGATEKVKTDNKQGLLNQMIDNLLIKQQAKKVGIVVRDEDVDGAINDLLTRRGLSREELLMALEKGGTTMEDYRKGVRDQLTRVRLVQREVKSKVAVSDEEIGTYYLKRREDYEGKETVRIKQILLLMPKGDDPAAKAELKARAEELHRRLLAGESFELLAAKYSQGPAAASGGDVGFIEKGMVLAEIEEAAFSLPIDQISPVIESSSGFHIIQVIDRRGGGIKSIESVREEIREKLDQEKIEKKFEEWLDLLRQKSHIEIKL
ncbi:MAG: peptidylprolyl isomerase [Deltaproteobacteria bacterium]|nr:peptidylprolyl isomerase [Deltaproteobacteria bacterium]